MKGKETKSSPSADLLVCFPSRAHLTLMPKPICSPGRHSEPNSRNRNHNHRHHSLKKSSTTRACGYGSPQLWARTKSMGSEIAEPTSPKVTCAGQIRVRPKNTDSRSWKSVMEEFVKIQNHNNKVEHKKGATWTRAFGFKKEALQFLVCTRGMRFSLCCFRETKVNTEVEEEEEHEDEDNHGLDHGNRVVKEEEEDRAIPPPNALLLMRCRSAPVTSCLENNEEQRREEGGKVVKEKSKEANQRKSLISLMEENRKKENLLVISSSLIAKETWISRSVSWNN
ncbi:hypothetical protein PIB30_039282 [Stylosanthes scabra]|uniref:Uncharacterized protein n=1 Tax=Stylosanthes scabra TaxID=79078 RepID=A0ABU6XCC6_9FABA|nr:hypothetical protein [Stylosanthes scabra]